MATTHRKLTKLNKLLEPYYALFTMIIFFGGLAIAAYKYLLDPSDLKLTIKNEDISYPSSISKSVEKLYAATGKNESLQLEGTNIYAFLVNTRHHKTLTLSNTSNKTLRGIKFKYLNVDHLTAYGASASFLTTKESDKLLTALQYDEAKKIVYLPENIDLPANSEILINLWGTFKDQFFNDDIVVSYDEGEAFIQTTYNIDGVKGYFLNYYFEFMLLALFLFSICYMVGINQIKKRYDIQANPVQPD